eukprot:8867605-Pyramimonas_sp.AAC.1
MATAVLEPSWGPLGPCGADLGSVWGRRGRRWNIKSERHTVLCCFNGTCSFLASGSLLSGLLDRLQGILVSLCWALWEPNSAVLVPSLPVMGTWARLGALGGPSPTM